jgi:hypothetical protein
MAVLYRKLVKTKQHEVRLPPNIEQYFIDRNYQQELKKLFFRLDGFTRLTGQKVS